ncbi:hypothetical protein FOCC_FOCC015017, partial [Frankliniella occidentalis]
LLVETQHGARKVFTFQISTIEDRPLLGNEACEELELVGRVVHPVQTVSEMSESSHLLPSTKETLIAKYKTLFTGLGEFATKVHIRVDPAIQPEMCPPRRYHFALIEKLKVKIASLVERGIVAPIIDEVPTFVSNLVVREKGDGDLRICLDPAKLNKAIVRQKYIIPTVDEIAHKVKDKAIFTVLDLKEGFWHATLEEESSSMCAFSTPFGLYKFLKMPFGLSCAPEIFQFYNEQVFKGSSANIYIDDCLVTGKDLAEHDRELTKASIVQADASQYGLGCCLLQGKQPVAFHSRVLTETEKQYAQIEKEMLALHFAALKFEKYIYGLTNVTFQTDHQPLVSIFKKPLATITNNRLKKLRLKMLKFQPQVEYLPGKYLYLADLLSRQCLLDPVMDDPEMVEVVHEVHGWPSDRNRMVEGAKPYWALRNDLFPEDGLVILGDRIVVPVALRNKALGKIHKAHLGIEKAKAKARQSLYWPAITNDIVTMIQACRICERHRPLNRKEPLIPHEVPKYPFQKVSIDIMELGMTNYLILEDNLSKWLDIKKLNSKSSSSVISALRQTFAIHGIPEVIYGDNNPLNSQECHAYARDIGSQIITSSPEYPRSDGLAEKGVHIAKQLLKKCFDAKVNYLDALLEYNNTPLSGMNVCPSQILMSRTCRTAVPMLQRNLEPKVVNVHAELKRKQGQTKRQHDLHAKVRSQVYQPGSPVAIRRGKKWEKGTVVRKHSAPRSYIVRTLDGRILRRNTFHLQPSKTRPDSHDTPMDVEGCMESVLNTNPVMTETHTETFVPTEPNEGEALDHDEDGLGQDQPGLDPQLATSHQNPSQSALTGRTTRAGRRVKPPMKYGYDE